MFEICFNGRWIKQGILCWFFNVPLIKSCYSILFLFFKILSPFEPALCAEYLHLKSIFWAMNV